MKSSTLPLTFRMDKVKATRIIKRCVATGSITLSTHAQQRMNSRKVSARAVLNCLERFSSMEEPEQDAGGNWSVKVTRSDGAQRLAVVVGIDWDPSKREHIVVMTVIN
jgi:hypothetical protein